MTGVVDTQMYTFIKIYQALHFGLMYFTIYKLFPNIEEKNPQAPKGRDFCLFGSTLSSEARAGPARVSTQEVLDERMNLRLLLAV